MKFTVRGAAITQGSKDARIVGRRISTKYGPAVVRPRAVLTEGTGEKPRLLRGWRERIAHEARAHMAANGVARLADGGVRLDAQFFLARPASVRRARPWVKPDLDKLVRAVGDALSGIAYADDCQLVTLVLQKFYADDRVPCVEITIAAVEP